MINFEKCYNNSIVRKTKQQNKKRVVENVADFIFKKLLVEGGNAVEGAVRINQENVADTVSDIYARLFKELKIDEKYTAVLGSTGKKLPGGTSGDIDIGIDKTKAGVDDFNAWAKTVEAVVNKLNLDCNILPALKQVSIAWPIVNTDGKQAGKVVQVDLMPVDDLEFNKFSKFTPQETKDTPYYKSTIRNSIFSAMANCMDIAVKAKGNVAGVGEDIPVDINRYHYSLEKGLMLRHQIRKQKKDGTYNKGWTVEGETLVSSNPQKIIDIFFGPGHSVKEVETPLGTWNLAMKSDLLKDKETMDMFCRKMKEDLEGKLERQNITLPKVIATAIDLPTTESITEAGGTRGEDFSEIDSPRQAMTKVHQLTGTKLRNFLNDFRTGLNDASLIINTTPKIDGHPFRVAWIDGNVYIETSYSGLMGAEEIKAQSIPAHERRFFDYVDKQDKTPLFKELKKYGLSGVKIMGELLANGEDFADENGTVTYVGTTYDATKLGKYGSVVIVDIKGATMDKLEDLSPENATKLKNFLAAEFSNKDVSYFDINQFGQEIDVKKEDFSKEVIDALFSVENASKLDAKTAENVKMQINADLTRIFKEKVKNPSIMKDNDPSLEGIAFKLNGNLYGVHYQSWKDIRQGYFKDIDEIKEYVKLFLAKIAGMKETSSLTAIVKELRNNIDKYQPIYRQHYKEFLARRKELTDKMLGDKSLPKFVRSVGQDRSRTLLAKFKDSDITDDLNSLLDVAVGKIKDMNGKTVCIIPGSFRPPHKGHWAMIQHYAKIADEVIVAISGQATVSARRPDKFGRTMPNYVAGQIIQEYCKAYNVKNVKIAMTMKLMQWVTWKVKTMKNVKILLGVSGKDDISRFSYFTTDRFQKENPSIEILPIDKYQPPATKSDGENISATYVRDHIDDKKALRKVLPDKLSDEQFEKVFSIINPPDGKYPPMDNKSVADALFVPESEKKVLKEGGNAFDDVVRINAENVDDTIKDFVEKFCEFTKITDKDMSPLGSTGKRLPGQSSGDLDIGISLTALSKQGIDIEDKNAWFDLCKKFSDKYKVEYYEYKSRGLSSVRWPIVNKDGKQNGEFVQVDMIPHKNLKMLQWGMFQSKEEPGKDYDKSAVRALLLQAIVKMGFQKVLAKGNVPKEGPDVPVKLERYEYKQNEGLFKMIKERPQKKDGTYGVSWKDIDKKRISDDPQAIIDFIFGKGKYKEEDLLAVKDVWDAFVDSDFYKNKKLRDAVKSDFEDKMKTFGFPYPKYVKFNESLEIAEAEDSNDRVAVFVTDGKNILVGRAPQSKGFPNGFDLMKGHAQVGEDLEKAAKREAKEECGLDLKNLIQISDKLKYKSKDTLTFFVSYIEQLPDPKSLKCQSFYEYNGKQYPEIAEYKLAPIDEIDKWLYKGLAKLVNDARLVEKIKNSLTGESLLGEGGNAVVGVDRINKANVDATVADFMSKVLPMLKISKKDAALLGSAGKKETSGDLDIGVGNVKDVKEFLTNAKTILDKNNIDNNTNFGLKEVSVKWPISNTDGQQEGKFVQVDLMPASDLEMIKWGMTPDQIHSKYKGVVRNLFICDIAGFADVKPIETEVIGGEEIPVVYERYVLSTTDGLYRRTYSIKGKKPGTITKGKKMVKEQFITADVRKIIKTFFSPTTRPEDLATVEGVWEEFKKTPYYKDEETRNKILTKTSTELQARGLDYPPYLNPTK